MPDYDFMVMGAGVFGSWIAYQLRRSGKTVALVDPYGPGNSRSSSGGESRIIRMSYGPDGIYAQWSQRSLTLWKQLFASINQTHLFKSTGVLWTVPEGDPRLTANIESLETIGVPHEALSRTEVEKRYPQLRFSWPVSAVFEPDSGVLLARRCVQAVVQEAIRIGVDYFPGVANQTSQTKIYACGPWLPKIFPGLLGELIHVTRQDVFFFGTPPGDRRFTSPAMPVWLDYSDPRGAYTVPDLENRGFKLAFDQHGPVADPDTMERVVSQESIEKARSFQRERFPDLGSSPLVETRVCQYENSSNGDFLIDRHPTLDNVWIAGAGSGHGFKHGPAVGEYVQKLLAGDIPAEPRFSLSNKTKSRARTVY